MKQYSSFYTIQPSWTVVDVGAWIGLWTIWAALKAKRVYALEPVTSSFRLLVDNMCRNRGEMIPRGIALGSQTGPAEMDITCLPSASTLIPGAWAHGAEYLYENSTKEIVDVMTWDDWVKDECLEMVHLMNMDIEGGELGALDGMTKVLPERIAIAIYHIPAPFHLIIQTLHEKGYVLDGLGYYDSQAKNRGKPHTGFFRKKTIPFQTPETYSMGPYELPTEKEAAAGLPFYWGATK